MRGLILKISWGKRGERGSNFIRYYFESGVYVGHYGIAVIHIHKHNHMHVYMRDLSERLDQIGKGSSLQMCRGRPPGQASSNRAAKKHLRILPPTELCIPAVAGPVKPLQASEISAGTSQYQSPPLCRCCIHVPTAPLALLLNALESLLAHSFAHLCIFLIERFADDA